jgi:pyridoxamine 5'-phosphate oxidase
MMLMDRAASCGIAWGSKATAADFVSLGEFMQEEELVEGSIDPDPFRQFAIWFKQAEEVVKRLPNAMALATATKAGQPSVRMVLLKGFDHEGFVFYTNYDSQKAEELADNPQASLLFYWSEPGRQVRITGRVAKVSQGESEAYFSTRPLDSQLGAWASRQSEVIPNREVLESRVRDLARKYEGRPVPTPPFWGGYRLVPDSIEFWQERAGRLHDRLRYRLDGSNWVLERLSP